MWGSAQAIAAEQVMAEVLCSVSTPRAGLVLNRSRKSGTWKPVFLIVRMNLWWIDTKGRTTCPEDITAWKNVHRVKLIRSKTTVDYIEGEFEWTVRHDGKCTEFKVDSRELAASWIAEIQY